MLTVSLHGINLHAKIGLYPEEKIKGNDFVVDVDVTVSVSPEEPLPFLDYVIIQALVGEAFQQQGELLETLVRDIHQLLRKEFPMAQKIRVSIKKLNPPMEGRVDYAMVCLEM
jgi:7,8-dihydroneopterin aldolase/epimerase/oxygenase